MKKTLIITHDNSTWDIRSEVYHETLLYIAKNIPGADLFRFTDNKDLLKHILKNNYKLVITTNALSCDTAFLIKGAGLAETVIGLDEDLSKIVDIMIDPLVNKSEKYIVGSRYLLPSILSKYSASALASIIGVDAETLTEEVNYNDAESDLVEIAQLYQKLEWDSNFFGINIGYISCRRLTPNIERSVKQFIRNEKIDLVEYLCNCHDRESVLTLERNNYSFVDMRLTFEQILETKKKVPARAGYSVRIGSGADLQAIKKIATDIYRYSRYYFDENFDRAKVVKFYQDWARKAVMGKFDDYSYVLGRKNEPVGFCTIKKTRKNAAKIGLFGVSRDVSGGGLASYLLNTVLMKLRREGISHVEVVTQGRNYAAQRLYQRCGFITKTTELWYHKWVH